tara:strand:- start:599 stop:1114 length:516 start_codon:yes stop_codon:yes gene_type:complete
MEPVTTTLAAIALVKAGLEHASDLKDIGSSIDNLLSHRDEKKPEETQQQKVLRQRTGEDGQDDTSISAVMDEVLAERTHQIALDNLAAEINKKWPTEKGEPTTWEIILKTREEKIQKAKKQKIKKREADDKFFDTVFYWLKQIAILSGVTILTAIAGYTIYINRCVNATCT